jgi:nucleoside phosphorylase
MADSARKHQIYHEQLDPEAERGRKRPRGDDEGHHGLAIHNGHQKQLRHQDYKIGIICALELEMSAIRYMLDDEHIGLREVHGDPNSYIVGTLSGHNVVITCLPENQGKGAAAIVATNMARTFPRIELRLLVGIGGGVPSDKHDIRLGDVVIGMPEGLHSGVIQYDLGKDTGDGFIRKGYLSPAPSALRSVVVRMQSDHRTTPNRISEFLIEMLGKREGLSLYQKPPVKTDILFTPDTTHVPGQDGCKNCDREGMAHRFSRKSSAPQIHYGLIASGDRVMRNARRTHLNAQSDLGDVL